MGKFENTISFPSDVGYKLDKLRPYIINYDNEVWDYLNGGPIYFEEGETRCILLVEHRKQLGFLLRYSRENLTSGEVSTCLYSLADSRKLSEFDELDDFYLPVGCFLNPASTWLALEDFINNPLEPSSRITWIPYEEITDWPIP